jgi:2',3'-cyclic-nucleotide 2'-phosphodiesterase (5'-nucleotidase family)
VTRFAAIVALSLAAACPKTPATPAATAPERKTVVLTIVGTNDLHGRVEALPVLAGYVKILRELRATDGGVLIVDAGDMFQGTLESNLSEGAAVVRAYNAIGYHAAAVGNHEFDFGPAGDATTPKSPTDDPRGALKARAAEARFPFLMANIADTETGAPPSWPNVAPSAIVEVAGVRVGVVGVTTLGTPMSTIAVNFAGLKMKPLAESVAAEAQALRGKGAALVVVAAHAGSSCKAFDDPNDLSACELDDEVFRLVNALPPGTVDAVVGGHSHAGVAHIVKGVPVIEAFSNGRAFGRIDLTVDTAAGRVVDTDVHAPRYLCARQDGVCKPDPYEGRDVVPDAAVAKALEPDIERARKRREVRLGVTVDKMIWRKYDEESPEGNLFTDLMRQARPDADVAITNGGGLRADILPGELTYGRFYEAFPFDNRFARVSMTGARLKGLFAQNLQRSSGILSISGARVEASCRGAELVVVITRSDGRAIADGDAITVVTSDFLASGGDGAFGPHDKIVVEEGLIREEMVEILKRRGGRLRGDDPALYDPSARRVVYPDERPVRCSP